MIERSRAIARLPARVSVPRFNAAGGARRTTRGGRKKKTSAALPWVTAPARANRRSRTDPPGKESQHARTNTPTPRFINQRSVWVAPGVFVQMARDETKVPRDAARRNAAVFGGAPYDAREEEAARRGGEHPTSTSFSSEAFCLGICRSTLRE